MRRRAGALVAALLILGCSDPSGLPPKSVTVTNNLRLAFAITGRSGTSTVFVARLPAAGTTPGTVSFDIPRNIGILNAAAEPKLGADGMPMANEVGGTLLVVGGTVDQSVSITNDFDGFIYYSPAVRNALGSTIAVANFDGVALACLGPVPPGQTSDGGYFYLRPTSEIRYYAGTTCTGTYRRFVSDTVSAHLEAKSGLAKLNADSLP